MCGCLSVPCVCECMWINVSVCVCIFVCVPRTLDTFFPLRLWLSGSWLRLCFVGFDFATLINLCKSVLANFHTHTKAHRLTHTFTHSLTHSLTRANVLGERHTPFCCHSLWFCAPPFWAFPLGTSLARSLTQCCYSFSHFSPSLAVLFFFFFCAFVLAAVLRFGAPR